MNIDFFKTEHVVPFLFYTMRDNSSISLVAQLPDEAVPISMEQVWSRCQVVETRNNNDPTKVFFMYNIVRNSIASSTRRGAGNFVWAHPETVAKLRAVAAEMNVDPRHFEGKDLIEDESVPTNELRSCYHKVMGGGAAGPIRGIDGPFQVVNGKQYHNPNYIGYFARALF